MEVLNRQIQSVFGELHCSCVTQNSTWAKDVASQRIPTRIVASRGIPTMDESRGITLSHLHYKSSSILHWKKIWQGNSFYSTSEFLVLISQTFYSKSKLSWLKLNCLIKTYEIATVTNTIYQKYFLHF